METLPIEIIELIINKLTAFDLINLSKVCTKFTRFKSKIVYIMFNCTFDGDGDLKFDFIKCFKTLYTAKKYIITNNKKFLKNSHPFMNENNYYTFIGNRYSILERECKNFYGEFGYIIEPNILF